MLLLYHGTEEQLYSSTQTGKDWSVPLWFTLTASSLIRSRTSLYISFHSKTQSNKNDICDFVKLPISFLCTVIYHDWDKQSKCHGGLLPCLQTVSDTNKNKQKLKTTKKEQPQKNNLNSTGLQHRKPN